MEIVFDTVQLRDYFDRVRDAALIAPGSPLLIDRFLDDAIENRRRCPLRRRAALRRRDHGAHRGGRIHSGDSACTLPPTTLGHDVLDRVRDATLAIARGVGVSGLINVQYAIAQDTLYVLEANPRASRDDPVRVEGARRAAREGGVAHHGRPVDRLAHRRGPAAGARRHARSRRRADRRQGGRAALQAVQKRRTAGSSTPCWGPRCARPVR